MKLLVIGVLFHDGRYHGRGSWPPGPFRLFQALVAGEGLRGPLGPSARRALQWLESLNPPVVAAPPARQVEQAISIYVPDNAGDSVGGDPSSLAAVRSGKKVFQPFVFDPSTPLLYAWHFEGTPEDETQAGAVCELASRLYQLGWGLDMAWAWGEIMPEEDGQEALTAYPGEVLSPGGLEQGLRLQVPLPGSLDSLERRYQAAATQFRVAVGGGSTDIDYWRRPAPRFQTVTYGAPSTRYVFGLQQLDRQGAWLSWPLEDALGLVTQLRDRAVHRLQATLPRRRVDVERVLVGRRADGSNSYPASGRIKIVPLPSIGHAYADHQIRRVLVEIPSGSLLRPDDVRWAFQSLDIHHPGSGELMGTLVAADDDTMLRHYGGGSGKGWEAWETVTPAVLPVVYWPKGQRRHRVSGGLVRRAVVEALSASVAAALRHAHINARLVSCRIQREPFRERGLPSDRFVGGKRFDGRRLWHVAVQFDRPVRGPLIIVDGRFVGLGVMAPSRAAHARSLSATSQAGVGSL
jgi:CRISPR-associated protein Csb2